MRIASTKTLFLSLALAGAASAAPVTLMDNYIGGNAFCQGCGGYAGAASRGWTNQDVIQGGVGQFEIDRMVVDRQGASLEVLIYSRYLNNIGMAHTTLGDLLIGAGGLDGSWEYALTVSPLPAMNSTGTSRLLRLTSAPTLSAVPNGYIYRVGEAYKANTGVQVATGSWAVVNGSGTTDTDDYLRFTLSYAGFADKALGLRFTYSCGNDIVQGEVPAAVPEPGTLALMGLGLGGLALAYRRRRKA